jgi:hypothetical protein
VAVSLNLVGYNAFTFKNLEEYAGRDSVPDEEIIPWCGDHGAIWVHADDNSKVEHRKLIIAHGIKTIWVYRPKGIMSSKAQLRALSYGLPRALDRLVHGHRHIAIRLKGEPPEHGYSITPFVI